MNRSNLRVAALALSLAPLGLEGPAWAQSRRAAPAVQRAWVRSYDGPDVGLGSFDGASAIVVDESGDVYVTGASNGAGTFSDYATLKYTPDGSLVWERRYDGPGSGNDYATALALDAAGDLYVTGLAWGVGTYWDYATLKYDADGNLLWIRHYDGPAVAVADDQPSSIAVDARGDVYVTGRSRGDGTEADYATVKYDPDGNELWVRRYDGPGSLADEAAAIALDAAGNAYVTGRSTDFWYLGEIPVYDFATVKYAPDGTEIWVRRSVSTPDLSQEAVALGVDAAGNLYVTGTSTDGFGFGFGDYETLKYDASGAVLWTRRHGGPANGQDVAIGLAVDEAGSAYVTGWSWSGAGGPLDWDFRTVKYDPGGDLLWASTFDGPAGEYDLVRAIAVDGRGGVYVTGISQRERAASPTRFYDYATLKYDAMTGARIWKQRYNGRGDDADQPHALAIDDLGNVYVTGEARQESSVDYTTMRYLQGTPSSSPAPIAVR